MPPALFLPESMALLCTLQEDNEPARHGVAVFCLFSLQEERGQLLPARNIWPAVAKALGGDMPLESGFPKPRSEFLVYGACHEHLPVAASHVRVIVNQLDKSLMVFGDRSWSDRGGKKPESFTRMPLDYAHAFGGPGFGQNPFGKGHNSCEHDALPNVEWPHGLIASPKDAPPPAGFNALPPDWPQRAQYLGNFDDAWLRNRWPYFPEGTDPEYYCIAPPDQRFSGYLRGDEKLHIENMHPLRARIDSTLPGKRCRLFCRRREPDAAGPYQELPTVAETLWLLPEQDCGVLLFRAGFLSRDDEASDIESFHAAWEDLDKAPLPASQYAGLFEKQLREKAAAFKPAPPPPAPDDAAPAKAVVESASPEPAPPPAPPPAALGEIGKALATFEADTREHLASQGWSKEEIERALAEEAPEPGFAAEQDEADELRQYLKSLGQDPATLDGMTTLQRMDLVRRLFSDTVEEQLRQMGLSPEFIDEFSEPLPGGDTPVDAVISNALTQLDAAGHDTAELRQALAELDAAAGAVAGLGQKAGSVPKISSKPDLKPPEPTAAPEPPRKPGEPITREGLAALLAAGAPLQGGDFSLADFSGMDLSGRDFSDCDFQRANLRGANLERCNLQRAMLDKAILDEAQLSGADLRHASLRRASMRRTVARGLKASDIFAAHLRMHQAQFHQCDFDNAQIRHAHLEGAVFEDCGLKGAIFYMCSAPQVSFFSCHLGGANFLAANLNEAELRGSIIEGACFAKAKARELRLQGVQGTAADFRRASLVSARGDAETRLDNARFDNADLRSCCWPGASLRQACFDQAWLDNADLNKADLTRASIQRCRMRGATLAKCLLQETDLSDSDMLAGSLRKAKLFRTVLRHCNLYGVDFFKAAIHEPDARQANLKQTLLEGLGL